MRQGSAFRNEALRDVSWEEIWGEFTWGWIVLELGYPLYRMKTFTRWCWAFWGWVYLGLKYLKAHNSYMYLLLYIHLFAWKVQLEKISRQFWCIHCTAWMKSLTNVSDIVFIAKVAAQMGISRVRAHAYGLFYLHWMRWSFFKSDFIDSLPTLSLSILEELVLVASQNLFCATKKIYKLLSLAHVELTLQKSWRSWQACRDW